MRALMYGAELGTPAEEGWTTIAGSWSHATPPHQAGSGFGGAAAAAPAGAAPNTLRSPNFEQALVELYARIAVRVTTAVGATWTVTFHNGGAEIMSVNLDGSQQVEARVAGVAQDTSTEVLADDTWYVLVIHVRVHATLGLIEIFLDNDVATPIATYSGDTTGGGANITGIELDGEACLLDDLVVNAITMAYDGGTGGVPVAGETITGGTSGATAVITAVDGVAASGRLYLRSVSGTFADDEAVTSSGTFVAVVNGASGLERNSGLISPHGYVKALHPDGAGAHTECTPVGVASNFDAVNDWGGGVASDADYVESGTPGARDFYALGALGSGITGVDAVQVVARAQKQGITVNGIELGLGLDATEYYDAEQALGASFAAHSHVWDTNPATGAAWDASDIADLQAGFRLTA